MAQATMPRVNRLLEFLSTIKSDLDRTVTFWLEHSIDEDHGGFFQCLDTKGNVYDTTKYCWFLSRQVWTLARLYNEMPRFRQGRLVEAAKKGAAFVMTYVKNPENNNKCYLSVTREGKPIKIQRSIFSECFYVLAMSEMYRMTEEDNYKTEALAMMDQIVHWVKVDSSGLGQPVTPPEPSSSLAIPMMLLCLIDQLETMTPSMVTDFAQLSQWCVDQVLKHVQREKTVVLENVSPEGRELPGSAGRLMNPGHAIESGWFLLARAQKTGDVDLQKIATETFIRASFQSGWDAVHGGIFYFMDVDGRPPTHLEWDMKLWWVHNEAMIASLLAYKHTKDNWFLDMFTKVFDYAYNHLVDTNHGEWFGYLSREGQVKIKAKGGPWKGCFHVPRCLMKCEQLLEELLIQSGNS